MMALYLLKREADPNLRTNIGICITDDPRITSGTWYHRLPAKERSKIASEGLNAALLQSFIFQKTSAVSVNEVVAFGYIMPPAFPAHDSASPFPVRLVQKLTTICVNQLSASQGSLHIQSDNH
ncbi:hypothetical protein I5485_21920 [Citrobacter farmeri]|uniref:hypothetical protein n=1 Tax=Citrobacter farmeri TaxID=67824 RepID=UPI001908610D|nr:hypothetical protein [Citrobacter farmeri]MBJ9165102.1 hypothetical protein [Citrobacter farmeri]